MHAVAASLIAAVNSAVHADSAISWPLGVEATALVALGAIGLLLSRRPRPPRRRDASAA